MMLERGDHILWRNALAIMEGRALAQLEDPRGGVVAGLERFCEVWLHVARDVDFSKAVRHAAGERNLGASVGVSGGVDGIGGRAVGETELGRAALLGLSACCLHEHRLGGGGREAGGERQLDELPARNLPTARQRFGQLQFLHALRH